MFAVWCTRGFPGKWHDSRHWVQFWRSFCSHKMRGLVAFVQQHGLRIPTRNLCMVDLAELCQAYHVNHLQLLHTHLAISIWALSEIPIAWPARGYEQTWIFETFETGYAIFLGPWKVINIWQVHVPKLRGHVYWQKYITDRWTPKLVYHRYDLWILYSGRYSLVPVILEANSIEGRPQSDKISPGTWESKTNITSP